MWVAVCDDDQTFLASFTAVAPEVLSEDDAVTYYDSGLELLCGLNRFKRPIDVLLLDVEMPGLSGIESAREIRKVSPATKVVFVTNYIEYALEGYDVEAIHYLLKPLDKEKLRQVLQRVRPQIAKSNILPVRSEGEKVFLPADDILYIESFHESLIAYTPSQSYTMHSTLKEMAAQLDQAGFYRVHRSYMVNLRHVRRIKHGKGLEKRKRWALLTNGEQVPVGERNLKPLEKALVDFWS